MIVRAIPKHSGGTRIICVPSAAEKATLRGLLGTLNRVQSTLVAAHGFRPRYNAVTAAEPHIGMAVTISVDLQDFFDHCTRDMAEKRAVPRDVLDEPLAWLTIRGKTAQQLADLQQRAPDPARSTVLAARQGLPTSPAIANLCARPLDDAILKLLTKLNYKVCTAGIPLPLLHTAAYTRYADDISVSVRYDPGQAALVALRDRIVAACVRCGFPINPRKTRIRRAVGGRREVVGVLVDAAGLAPTRRQRRALRAAMCNAARENRPIDQAGLGLAQWCRLPRPADAQARAEQTMRREKRAYDTVWHQAEVMAHHRGVTIDRAWGRAKTLCTQALDYGARITVDPRDILSMGNVRYPESSSYSCLRAGGAYARTVVWWLACPGTAIAVIGSRSLWHARTIVYHMRDGSKWYGKIYGYHAADRENLRRALERAGIDSVTAMTSPCTVHGNVASSVTSPYLDYGQVVTVRVAGEERQKLVFVPR